MHTSWAADRALVVRAPRVPRRQRARASDRPCALRPLPDGVRRTSREDPGARRVASELRERREGAGARTGRCSSGHADVAAPELQRIARSRTCSPRCSRRRWPPSTSSTGSSGAERAVVAAFSERIEYRADESRRQQDGASGSARPHGQAGASTSCWTSTGPPHDRRFVCAPLVDGEQVGTGAWLDQEGRRAGSCAPGARCARRRAGHDLRVGRTACRACRGSPRLEQV